MYIYIIEKLEKIKEEILKLFKEKRWIIYKGVRRL